MRRLRPLWRGFLALVVLIVAITVGISVYFRVEQYRFRRQAERLLADVRQLELRKASAEEVRRVVRRWGFEEWRRPHKPCTEDDCMYRFQLMPKPARAHNFPDPFTRGPTVRVLEWLGSRPSIVQAWLEIRGKALQSISFSVDTLGRGCKGNDCRLVAIAGSKWENSLSEDEQPDVRLKHSLLHPSYLVGTYPTTWGAYGFSGVVVWAEFSPDANPSDVSRLMQFDLSCLTRLRSCRDRDLIPTVWAQSVEDTRESPKILTCTPELGRRVAQLADMIAVVRPETAELGPPRYEGRAPQLLHVEIISVIKKTKYLRRSDHLNVGVDSREMTTTADTQSPIREGQRYLFLLQDHPNSGWTALYPCGILTLNDANLAMVREEVASDP